MTDFLLQYRLYVIGLHFFVKISVCKNLTTVMVREMVWTKI
jgi:hypothetical protein